jgi:hypothetical protein
MKQWARLMLKIESANPSSWSGKLATLAFASICGWATLARADDMRILGNLGDAHKAVGLITHYNINADARSLDLFAAIPSVSSVSRDVERRLAGDTAREICGEGTAEGVSGWTVRIFMPGETTPAGACRMGGHH